MIENETKVESIILRIWLEETEEEIGIVDIIFIEGPKLFDLHDYSHFNKWYKFVLPCKTGLITISL